MTRFQGNRMSVQREGKFPAAASRHQGLQQGVERSVREDEVVPSVQK